MANKISRHSRVVIFTEAEFSTFQKLMYDMAVGAVQPVERTSSMNINEWEDARAIASAIISNSSL